MFLDRDSRSGGGYHNNRGGRGGQGERYSDFESSSSRRGSGGRDDFNNYSSHQQQQHHHQNNNDHSTSSFPPSQQQQRVQPIMSFKSFIASQPEDLPPEVFQRQYEQYNIEYLQYFSESFFKASMGEEWFQDRYNPVNILTIEKESNQWAIEEAERFQISFNQHSEEFISSCSLEPSAALSSSSHSVGDEGFHSGRHLPGHENRAIYVTGIHACCPKQVLKAAIISALTSDIAESTNKPDRIIIAQPVWSVKNLDKFERFALLSLFFSFLLHFILFPHFFAIFPFPFPVFRAAWVIMPTSSSAKSGVSLLRDLEVKVPTLPDPVKGETETAYSFRLSATVHLPRQGPPVNDYMSSSMRIQSDIYRAFHLIRLLDEDREIPLHLRLLEVLVNSSIANDVIKKPNDLLDLSIAYLRRVHFVSFYAGRRYRDESHLLTMAPGILFRTKAYYPTNNDSTFSLATILKEVSDPSSTVSGNEQEEEQQQQQRNEEKSEERANEIAAGENDLSSGAAETNEGNEEKKSISPAPSSSSSTAITNRFKGVSIHDRKIGPMIADLTQKLAIKKARLADPSLPGTIDEEDAKQIQEQQDSAFFELVKQQSKPEPDDKCRCGYEYCNKLFKSLQFLIKHLKTKHINEFGYEILLNIAEPFMRKRYEAEDITARPLPPVEVEGYNGQVDLRSVKEIMEKYMKPILPPPPMPVPFPGVSMGGYGGPPPLPFGPPPTNYPYNDNYNNGGNRRWSSGNYDNNNRGQYRNNNGNKRGRDYSEDFNSQSLAPVLSVPSESDLSGTTISLKNDIAVKSQSSRSSYPPAKGLNPYLDVDAPKVRYCFS
jgi:hypothetical protein